MKSLHLLVIFGLGLFANVHASESPQLSPHRDFIKPHNQLIDELQRRHSARLQSENTSTTLIRVLLQNNPSPEIYHF